MSEQSTEIDVRLTAIREASKPLIPGSLTRYVSMRDVERIFAEYVTSPTSTQGADHG